MQGRKRNRKQDFDYSQNAVYFVTILTFKKIHYFGKVADKKMQLNSIGKIVEKQILWLENQYSYFELHNFVVMPNHLHLLFRIDSTKSQQENIKIKSVSSLMGVLKTASSKQIHLSGNEDFSWHRSFHDHIVQTENAYNNINNYITNNPEKWDNDKFYGE